MTRVRGLLAVVVVGLLTACTSDSPDASPTASGEPLPSPTATSKVEELEGDRFRVWPVSAPVDDDTAYEFTVYTHCGVAQSPIDFDGSMWDYDGPKRSNAGLDDPEAEGVIRLTADDTAEFVAPDGARLELTRMDGPKTVPGCM
jgi:hypothetical protein